MFFRSYAIQCAAEYGHLEVVRLLLQDSRVDPSANDNKATISASQMKHLFVVNLLLADSRVDPSARGNEALKRSNKPIRRLLLRHPQVASTPFPNELKEDEDTYQFALQCRRWCKRSALAFLREHRRVSGDTFMC
mgnify:CR=1 FL=1